jgi:hypothetical protein
MGNFVLLWWDGHRVYRVFLMNLRLFVMYAVGLGFASHLRVHGGLPDVFESPL